MKKAPILNLANKKTKNKLTTDDCLTRAWFIDQNLLKNKSNSFIEHGSISYMYHIRRKKKHSLFLFQERTTTWRKREVVTKQDAGPDAITSLK